MLGIGVPAKNFVTDRRTSTSIEHGHSDLLEVIVRHYVMHGIEIYFKGLDLGSDIRRESKARL